MGGGPCGWRTLRVAALRRSLTASREVVTLSCGPEQPTRTENGRHAIDEQLQSRRQHRGHDVEPVGRAVGEPVLNGVGHLFGGTGNGSMPLPPPGVDPTDGDDEGSVEPTKEDAHRGEVSAAVFEDDVRVVRFPAVAVGHGIAE